jgi:uncharacterized flavoprotein (TIGR03862 family)
MNPHLGALRSGPIASVRDVLCLGRMKRTAIIIGAGPAGLAAAEILAEAGWAVTIHDRMPSPARKFLLAGRGGLNLTHSEPLEAFLDHYGPARERLAPAIRAFPPQALRAWCDGLGVATFVGTSGRVFPTAMKASPLLRAWLRRLEGLGVKLVTRSRWLGWSAEGALRFATPESETEHRADAAIFALGGASWPRLGSDGSWREAFAARGATITPLQPANSGILIAWSELFSDRFAGQPLKPARFMVGEVAVRGEAIVTRDGLEGGAIYALSRPLRDALARSAVRLDLDLHPDVDEAALATRLDRDAKASLSNRLRKAGLSALAASLLRERANGPTLPAESAALAALIKRCPLTATGLAPIDRAISTAGGLGWDSVGADYALDVHPTTFVCGEMLDWDAPTGGYLLQACFATGRAAAEGALARTRPAPHTE